MSAPSRDVQGSMFPDLVPARPQGWIMPSVFTGTNAELMAAVAPMYLTGSVLDVTYGEGKWWDKFKPDPFTFHDLHKVDGVDFTDLPEDDAVVDAVCFDPPYVLSGGESTGTMAGGDFQGRFGIGQKNVGKGEAATYAKRFEQLLHEGLLEACRVTKRFVLVKCMEFAGGSDGFHNTPFMMTTWAVRDAGMLSHDVIVHHTGSGPGGHNIFVPKRARRHHSYLLVFTKAKS